MKASVRYAKIVEWSDEDQCYVGSSPGLVYGGCHGDDETSVFEELIEVVEDAIALYEAEGRPLPPPTSGKATRTRCSTWYNSCCVGRLTRPLSGSGRTSLLYPANQGYD